MSMSIKNGVGHAVDVIQDARSKEMASSAARFALDEYIPVFSLAAKALFYPNGVVINHYPSSMSAEFQHTNCRRRIVLRMDGSTPVLDKELIQGSKTNSWRTKGYEEVGKELQRIISKGKGFQNA
jgi:hypothetical protein